MDSEGPGARNAPTELLHQVSRLVSSDRSLEEVLNELVRLAVEATSSDACLVYLLDQESGEIVLRASHLPHAAEVGSLRLSLGEGITGWVAKHKSVVALGARASLDERFKAVPGLEEDSYEAFLSAPLVSEGRVIGVINVHHRRPHAHSPEEIAFLSFLGEQLGGALERARLREVNARLQEEAELMRKQLEARKLVERAKGILQRRMKLTEEEAYLRLRNESRRQRRSMRDLAAVIIEEELRLRGEKPE